MGKPAAFLGSQTSGHSCYSSTQVLNGSPDVKINGKPAARVTDPTGYHQCSNEPHDGHSSSIAAASPNVFINGKAAACLGSRTACGDTIVSNLSANVSYN